MPTTSESPAPVPRALGGRLGVPIVVLGFVALAGRQLAFVNRYAVNLMFGDQWDFYGTLFRGESWWKTFDYQHGPHREGLGLVVVRLFSGPAAWNSRWDAFETSLVLLAAAGVALGVARKFGVARNSLSLLALPLMFLNVHQFEIFVGATNLSHGAMPVLLLMAYCRAWFTPGPWARAALVGGLTFLLIFTGFGMFGGALTPPLALMEGIQAWRSRQWARLGAAAALLAATAASWAGFAVGYTFQPAVPHFRFPYERPGEYFTFTARMCANFFGIGDRAPLDLVVGFAVAGLLLAICLWHGLRLARRGVGDHPQSVVLFCLSGFALLYCFNTAVGRVFTLPNAALASRYVTLLIPAALALFLQATRLARRPALRWAGLAYAVLLVPATCLWHAYEIQGAEWFSSGRREWRQAYLETHSEEEAGRRAHFTLYPGSLHDRLAFLEARRLNLFAP